MALFRKYKFTLKHHPKDGIMSAVLGLISFVAIILLFVLSYRNGEASQQNGLTAALALIFALTGLVLGIVGNCHREVYRFFPTLGIVLNALTLLAGAGIIYLGA